MQSLSLSVRQLNTYVRSLLEGDAHLASFTLEGELSGFKNHYGSGHWYFVLKDSDASVKAVMFKGNASNVSFIPRDGMRVICRGYVSLYERDGQFQFYAETMRPFGEGDIAAEFERIKNKLDSEGLFDVRRKRPIPEMPRKIGVITSDSGAALQDILQILNRRFSLVEVVVFPALVQGSAAPKSLMDALDKAYIRDDLDVLIIGRGGGSTEDLMCFNDEALARKISVSPIPIVSAVGHEIDFTICDFVSDLRAPTPSAAAELVVPSTEELSLKISVLLGRAKRSVGKLIENESLKLEFLKSRPWYASPENLFYPFEAKVGLAEEKMRNSFLMTLKNKETSFEKISVTLESLSPTNVLDRGYSVVYAGDNIIRNADAVKVNDVLDIRFANGSAKVKVIDKNAGC